jgi:hypothetical protein
MSTRTLEDGDRIWKGTARTCIQMRATEGEGALTAWHYEDCPLESISDLKKRAMLKRNGISGGKAVEMFRLFKRSRQSREYRLLDSLSGRILALKRRCRLPRHSDETENVIPPIPNAAGHIFIPSHARNHKNRDSGKHYGRPTRSDESH